MPDDEQISTGLLLRRVFAHTLCTHKHHLILFRQPISAGLFPRRVVARLSQLPLKVTQALGGCFELQIQLQKLLRTLRSARRECAFELVHIRVGQLPVRVVLVILTCQDD